MDAKKHVNETDPLGGSDSSDPIALTDADQARLVRDDRDRSKNRARRVIGLGVVLALVLLMAARLVTHGVEAGQ